MEDFAIFTQNDYKIILYANNDLLNIYINNTATTGSERTEFLSAQERLKDSFKKYFKDFKDLIQKINQREFNINPNIPQSTNIKYLHIKILDRDNIEVFSKKIFAVNVKYYLVKGPNNERMNLAPYSSLIEKDYININIITDFIYQENLLNSYIIDGFRYKDELTASFKSIGKENIKINDIIYLEFHIGGKKDYIMAELKYKNNYYTNEIIKIRNRINQYTNIIKKYDLIYLYASPVVSDDNYSEYNAPISYMEEIRHIMNIMENSGKKFNCKFECADDEVLRDVLKNYKTKILHISAHGKYDNQKYSLVLENLNDKGKSLDINSD